MCKILTAHIEGHRKQIDKKKELTFGVGVEAGAIADVVTVVSGDMKLKDKEDNDDAQRRPTKTPTLYTRAMRFKNGNQVVQSSANVPVCTADLR